MSQIEAELKVQSFFVMDENFLLHRTRGHALLERMKAAGKSWELSVFASANAIRKVHHAGTGGAGSFVGLDGTGIAAIELQQAAGHGRDGN